VLCSAVLLLLLCCCCCCCAAAAAACQATMTEQLEVAMLLGGGLSAAGFVRVYVTNGSLLNAFAISVSLLAIVFASVVFGTGLPFALARGGVDPAHAGTSIQVCAVCSQQVLVGTNFCVLLGRHAATSICTQW
jgi:hypothetical protein